MMKLDGMWARLYAGVGVLAVLIGSSVEAAVYRIDSQVVFDFYRAAVFKPGDTILFTAALSSRACLLPGAAELLTPLFA